MSQFDILDQRHALCWDLATMRAVKYTPQGEVLGNVLELMLGPRCHERMRITRGKSREFVRSRSPEMSVG